MTRGGKRENAGRKPGSSGIKKTKLKARQFGFSGISLCVAYKSFIFYIDKN